MPNIQGKPSWLHRQPVNRQVPGKMPNAKGSKGQANQLRMHDDDGILHEKSHLKLRPVRSVGFPSESD
ncbi:similar to An04g00190 [Aspergillus luchuensis]|uniref:Similar to An04g00190 n=1 Tax=Aspergillus kawachii TaxID=1069201 RepID=A0A146FPG1_ASPKA|nr:similar to An04g00190 [Aspergillus luchuensis]